MPNRCQRTWDLGAGALSFFACLLLFWPAITGRAELAFRDSGSFYQPLYQWSAQQWKSGQIPLWCNLDNWGGPVLADGTSGIFYPAKLIFLLPVGSFSCLFAIFVAAHVFLAILGCRWSAARIGLGPAGQWLAAISFGLGGYNLFQTCNVVFLIGAAWLPWSLGNLVHVRILSARTVGGIVTEVSRPLIGLGATQCMMILAGDPQMAFHVSVVTVCWLGTDLFRLRIKSKAWFRHAANTIIVMAALIVFVFSLAAVQILPSLEWAQKSTRQIDCPPNCDPSSLQNQWSNSIHRVRYEFSMPPWQLLEMVWPNVLGKVDFATNRRWSSELPGADRVWAGSIYIGCLSFLLGLSYLFQSRRGDHDHFLVWVGVIFLLASFGWYGFGWLANELNLMRGGSGITGWVSQPCGGIYWVMENLIPGYQNFRYPAKLLPIFILCFCILAGRGLDHWSSSYAGDNMTRRFIQWSTAFAATSLVGSILLFVLDTSSTDLVPFSQDMPGVIHSIQRAMMHSALVSGLVLVLAWGKSIQGRPDSWRLYALLALLVGDLLTANRWTVCSTPLVENRSSANSENQPAIYRPVEVEANAQSWLWLDMQSQLALDRQTLYPKHHLQSGQRVIGSYHSIEPQDTSLFLNEVGKLEPPDQVKILAALSVGRRARLDQVHTGQNNLAIETWHARPEVYLANQISILKPVSGHDWRQQVNRTSEFIQTLLSSPFKTLATDDDPNDVILECDEKHLEELLEQAAKATIVDDKPFVPWLREIQANQRGENRRIRYRQKTPGIVVVADYYDPNWIATATDQTGDKPRVLALPILRVNRLLRALVVPGGDFLIQLHYRPTTFFWGAWIGVISWVLLIIGLAVSVTSKGRRQRINRDAESGNAT